MPTCHSEATRPGLPDTSISAWASSFSPVLVPLKALSYMTDRIKHWSDFQPACRDLLDHLNGASEDAFCNNQPLQRWPSSSLEQLSDKLSLVLLKSTHVLSSMLAALRHERNARVPISDVPAEVLAQIFNAVKNLGNLDTYRDLLSVSHTCSFWRQICLAHPDLWTRIMLTRMSKQIAWLYAERSDPHPLLVQHPPSRRIGCSYLETFCETHLQRAKTVAVDLHGASALIRNLPYENIEDLYVSSDQSPGTGLDLGKHAMPRLQTFKARIHNLFNPPTSLHTLTSLSLTFNCSTVWSMHGVLDIFREAPGLTQITVNKNLDSPDHALGLYEGDRIYMNCAQTFNVCLGVKDLEWLLSAIVLPEAAMISLQLPDYEYPARIAISLPSDPTHLPRLFHFSTIELAAYKTDSLRDKWYIKFIGPIRGGSTGQSRESWIRFYLGQTHWRGAVDILGSIACASLIGNTDKLRSLHLKNLRFFTSSQRSYILKMLCSHVQRGPFVKLTGCSRSWPESVARTLIDWVLLSGTTRSAVVLSGMAVPTTSLRAVYESSKAVLVNTSLVLRDCKLRSDDGRSWMDDLETIRDLGVRVQLQKKGVVTYPLTID